MVVIGEDSVNSKQIQRLTGAKITIRDHELDPNLRNIKFDGTFDQIKQATVIVRELIFDAGFRVGGGMRRHPGILGAPLDAPNYYKPMLCESFTKGLPLCSWPRTVAQFRRCLSL